MFVQELVTTQIPATGSLSPEVDVGEYSLVGIIVPANWTTAGLSFQVSVDGVTWAELTTAAGTPYAIGSVAAGARVAIDPTTLKGARALKIRSGTQAAPVAQTNTVTLTLVGRVVF